MAFLTKKLRAIMMKPTWLFLLLLGYSACCQTPQTPQNTARKTDAAFATKADVAFRLPFVTSATDLATQTSPRVFFDGSEWVRKTGTVTPNVGLTVGGPAGTYYERVVANGIVTLSMFGGSPAQPDNGPALQRAIDAQVQTGYRIVIDKPGTYLFSGTVTKAQSFTGLTLDAVDGVVFQYATLRANTPFLRIVGGSGGLTRATIRNITFQGNAGSVAIECAGQCGQRITDCHFRRNGVGIRFHNDVKGSFTEHCVAQNCDFYNECAVAIQYKRTAGDPSFHGSGLEGRNLINTVGTVVQVGTGCLPYNCPLAAQVWVNDDQTVLVENSNANIYTPTFFGQMSVELMTKTAQILLAAGTKPTYYAGPLLSNGDRVTGGQLVTCDGIVYKENGTVVTRAARYNTAVALTKGPNRMQVPLQSGTFLVNLHCLGPNYDYRYTLLVQNEGFGGPGFVTTLANQRSFNGTGWGAPTLAVDAEGQLLITGPAYPAKGVTAYLTYSQIGDWPVGNYPAKSF
jgi:hypothetical protein